MQSCTGRVQMESISIIHGPCPRCRPSSHSWRGTTQAILPTYLILCRYPHLSSRLHQPSALWGRQLLEGVSGRLGRQTCRSHGHDSVPVAAVQHHCSLINQLTARLRAAGVLLILPWSPNLLHVLLSAAHGETWQPAAVGHKDASPSPCATSTDDIRKSHGQW